MAKKKTQMAMKKTAAEQIAETRTKIAEAGNPLMPKGKKGTSAEYVDAQKRFMECFAGQTGDRLRYWDFEVALDPEAYELFSMGGHDPEEFRGWAMKADRDIGNQDPDETVYQIALCALGNDSWKVYVNEEGEEIEGLDQALSHIESVLESYDLD